MSGRRVCGSRPDASALSRSQGAFNIVMGLWPILHMRSFETVSGPKVDRWLVRTVGGLMAANGFAQVTAGPSPSAQRISRRVGVGTAAWLAAIDVRYATTGRISRVYLLDAVVQLGWLAAWAAAVDGPEGNSLGELGTGRPAESLTSG